MKNLFFIFLLFFILTSCNTTPENKIAKSFSNEKIINHKVIKIKSIEIYDTIYMNEVIDELSQIQNKVELYEKNIKIMRGYRDSVNTLDYPDSIRHSLIEKNFKHKRLYERELNYLFFSQTFHHELYTTPIKDSICGYYTRIITNKDTFNFVITYDFSLLCPTFMFEK
jgi:hypothetical protein